MPFSSTHSKDKGNDNQDENAHSPIADSDLQEQAGADWRKFKRLKRLQEQLSYDYKGEPALWGERV